MLGKVRVLGGGSVEEGKVREGNGMEWKVEEGNVEEGKGMLEY